MDKSDRTVLIASLTITVFLLGGLFIFAHILHQKKIEKDYISAQQLLIDTRDETGQKKNPLEGRQVSFVGLDDTTVQEGGKITLENLAANEDFLMVYTITDLDTGKELVKTEMIPSGKKISWDPSITLKKGVHHLSFLQTPFYMNENGTYVPLTAGNNEVTVTIQ